MKLKAEITRKQLSELGFYKPDLDGLPEDFYNWFDEICSYIYKIGDGRRGQTYYLGIERETLKLLIYASESDGDGCHTEVGDIFIKLIQNNFIEL